MQSFKLNAYKPVQEIECKCCKKVHAIFMTPMQFEKYYFSDERVQYIFPNISIEQRELLTSGTCGMCFDKQFNNWI